MSLLQVKVFDAYLLMGEAGLSSHEMNEVSFQELIEHGEYTKSARMHMVENPVEGMFEPCWFKINKCLQEKYGCVDLDDVCLIFA